MTGGGVRGRVFRMKIPGEILESLESRGLLRSLRPAECREGGMAVLEDGTEAVNFASNDYLGLARHPKVTGAFEEGIGMFGAGSMASRLVTGTRGVHLALEEKLAGLKGTEAALSFSSGYAASVGLVPVIAGKGDVVILDKLSHASLIDGARLSGARVMTFLHNDPSSLERKLSAVRRNFPEAEVLVVTESVFSMDGDKAPLRELVEVKERYGARLLVDEAHGFGVMGPRGAGLAAELGVSGRIDFQMGTLSKAVGLSGGYVACRREWADMFINGSRSLIYSTAPPPALAYAAMAALDLIEGPEGDGMRRHLNRLIRILSDATGLDGEGHSPVFPLVIGESAKAVAVSAALGKKGFLVPAIRYPTVPDGTARLRVTLTAAHSEEQVRAFAAVLKDVLRLG